MSEIANYHQQVYLYRTSTGEYWLPESRTDHLIQTIINNQIFDQPLLDEMTSRLKQGDTVLDVGSNFGQTAVLLSKAVGPSGTVLAFEAEPWVYEVLKRNIKQNLCTNTQVYFGAVWDELGQTLLYPKDDLVTYESHGSYGINPIADTGQSIPSITIDSLELDRVDLIKIDVQGADLRAMKGCRSTIQQHRPTIIFEYEPSFDAMFNTTWQDYLDFIVEIDYRIVKTISYVNVLIEPNNVDKQ